MGWPVLRRPNQNARDFWTRVLAGLWWGEGRDVKASRCGWNSALMLTLRGRKASGAAPFATRVCVFIEASTVAICAEPSEKHKLGRRRAAFVSEKYSFYE